MNNRVDYQGRTSCGCPYLNTPDPKAHWPECSYRLNAEARSNAAPATADSDVREVKE